MENLRVKVSNESESKEVQELFIALGATCGVEEITSKWVCLYNGQITFYDLLPNVDFKKITLQELRDMVVLKRSDPKDANVYQDGDISCLYDLYLTGNKELYFYHCGKKAWILSNLTHDKDYYELLKPIKEEVMKEYLFKYNDQYTLVELSKEDVESNPEQYIEVPDGADVAVYPHFSKGISFFKNNFRFAYSDSLGEWRETDYCSENLKHWKSWRVAWQRESLNDKIATAEVARQEEKHSHYKKDVSHLNVIDVYRVLELYGVESHAVGHAIKKLLCCGQRGAKGRKQDIQEAIDSLNRELEMVEEDEL